MSHLTFEEAELVRELTEFAQPGKYTTVTVPSHIFLKLASSAEREAADRATLEITREIVRLAVARGWSKKEIRAAYEDAYSEATGSCDNRTVSAHGAPVERTMDDG